MEPNEFIKRLEDDPELAQNLKEAMGRNANIEVLSGILTGAGVDPDAADELLAKYQRKCGAVIGTQELDDEALDQVAGGGDGLSCYSTEDCDQNFKEGCDGYFHHPNGGYGCNYETNCDESFYCEQSNF